jgi:hypothetical protein
MSADLPGRGSSKAGESDTRIDGGRASGPGPVTAPQPAPPDDGFDPHRWLADLLSDVRQGFEKKRLLMSFGEYFSLFAASPARHSRSAAQYLRDVFDHFGSTTIASPRGPVTRWRLFDCAWEDGKDALMG